MKTLKKVMLAVLVSFVGCVSAEQGQAASETVQEETQTQATTSTVIVDDAQENQELEKYLQELSQEFEEADAKK